MKLLTSNGAATTGEDIAKLFGVQTGKCVIEFRREKRTFEVASIERRWKILFCLCRWLECCLDDDETEEARNSIYIERNTFCAR